MYTTFYSIASSAYALSISLPFALGPHIQMSHSIAAVLTIIVYISVMLYIFGFGVCLLTRYASVYHSQVVALIDEKRALAWIKCVVLGASLTMPFVEYTWLTQIEDTVTFTVIRYGQRQGPMLVERLKPILNSVVVLIMLVLQLRLEYDNVKYGDNSFFLQCVHYVKKLMGKLANPLALTYQVGEEEGGFQDNVDVNNHALRILVILASLIPIVLIFHATVGLANPMYGLVFSYLAITVLGPGIYILNHKGLSKLALSRVKSLL